MKNIIAILVLSSTVASLTILAKSDLVLELLVAALGFAARVLPASAWIAIKFVV